MAGFKEYDDMTLATAVALALTPELGVSSGAQETCNIGAKHLARHLIAGDWETETENVKSLVQEFIGRVVANASRKGIDLELIAPVADPSTE
jgi:hypothetical protein